MLTDVKKEIEGGRDNVAFEDSPSWEEGWEEGLVVVVVME